ncbi:MAG: FAD-dependent oxidoreductase [Acidobacteriia bacterium]|nr:FAD-dependent oxidoreductase [Terriglobia bacterium]
MTTWNEYAEQRGTLPEWPYPVQYDKESEIAADVLIIGGGVAGSHAAISAARLGAKVVIAETGHLKRSGSGGSGVDHWHGACKNPCSKVTPLDYTQAVMESAHGYSNGMARYITCSEGWDTLLECEEIGVQIRDVHDEFKGAEFRDDETKLMFAYDYTNRHIMRVWGYNLKQCLYYEMKRLGVEMYNRTVVTSLLTEGGRQGGRVVGATGVNMRTGEFYVFRSKATIIASGGGGRLYSFAPELTASSSMSTMNSAGTGHAVGWDAGAEFVLMEQTGPGRLSGFGYAPYSMGNTHNTYHGTSIVDANGKEVPWFDPFGRELKTVEQRFLPNGEQRFQLGAGIGLGTYAEEYRSSDLARDLPERIRKGEFQLPLYADLTRLSEMERRCIWGMMIGNEGKSRIPIYDTLTKAGFDPDKDMLQAPVMVPEAYQHSNFWGGTPIPHLRSLAGGGFLVDWDLRTSLEGLYAAGTSPVFGAGCHGESHTMGRYAARKAAAYAKACAEPVVDRQQVAAEKARAYRPIKQNKNGAGWKELNYAIARVMQDYCGKYKNLRTLNRGLSLLKELKENEGAAAYAANPHELGRMLECFSLITLGEMVMHASLERKCSSAYLDFYRLDYPQMDPPEWEKHLPMRQEDGRVAVRELPLDFHLKAPYAPSYEENYERHAH